MNALGIVVVIGVGLLFVSLFLDRVVNPFLCRRRFEKFLKSNKRLNPRALEDPKYGSVVGNFECLTIKRGKGDSVVLFWNEIEAVYAFKRDLFSVDLICLSFKKSAKEEYYEINEDMVGYHDLIEAMPTHLPGFNGEWFSTVAFPAFKTNQQVIWRRNAECGATAS